MVVGWVARAGRDRDFYRDIMCISYLFLPYTTHRHSIFISIANCSLVPSFPPPTHHIALAQFVNNVSSPHRSCRHRRVQRWPLYSGTDPRPASPHIASESGSQEQQLIDFGMFLHGSDADKLNVVAGITEGFRNAGFVYTKLGYPPLRIAPANLWQLPKEPWYPAIRHR